MVQLAYPSRSNEEEAGSSTLHCDEPELNSNAPPAIPVTEEGSAPFEVGVPSLPFVVESARPLDDLRPAGEVGVSFRWRRVAAPDPEDIRAAAALCAAHPGPAPVYIEWSDGNGEGEALRLRSRRMRVAADDDLLTALQGILGPDSVHYVKAE